MRKFLLVALLVCSSSFAVAQDQQVPVITSQDSAKPDPADPTIKALRDTLSRLERRLIALEQQAPATGAQKNPIVTAITNGRKQVEAACKEAGGKWMWSIPLSTDQKQQSALQGNYFVGCVGR